MADLNTVPIRYFQQTDEYTFVVDNRPLEDLNARIVLVNNQVGTIASEITLARGSQNSLSARINVALNADGTIKSSALPNDFSLEDVNDEDTDSADDRLALLRGEREKLARIEEMATRFTLRLDDTKDIRGNLRLVAGKTIRLSLLPSSKDERVLFIDTIFPHDRLHEHRTYQMITNYSPSDGLAKFPTTEDDALPGSVRVFHNGLMLKASSFEEVVDSETGLRNAVRILVDAEKVDLAEDDLWVEYEIAPTWDSLVADPLFSGVGIPALFEHDLSDRPGDDWRSVSLPEGSTSPTQLNFWLIDITHLNLVEPYDRFVLFASEDSWPPSAAPYGLTARFYGHDWDIVEVGNSRYIRWRYDANVSSGTDGVPNTNGDSEDWFTEHGSGSESEPNENYAPVDLEPESRVRLLYFEPVL